MHQPCCRKDLYDHAIAIAIVMWRRFNFLPLQICNQIPFRFVLFYRTEYKKNLCNRLMVIFCFWKRYLFSYWNRWVGFHNCKLYCRIIHYKNQKSPNYSLLIQKDCFFLYKLYFVMQYSAIARKKLLQKGVIFFFINCRRFV